MVLSSSVIPGNEISVQKLKDNLYRNGVTLIHYRSSDVHSTGHGNTGELVWINQQINAKFFMPAYGYYSMTKCHAKAVEQAGRPRESIIIADNGTVIDMIEGKTLNVHKEKVPSSPLVVDGFSIGDMQEVVIRDRQALSKDGMFVIIATVNLKTGKLRKSPDIISRGFIYLRESQDLLNTARLLIKKTVEDSTQGHEPGRPRLREEYALRHHGGLPLHPYQQGADGDSRAYRGLRSSLQKNTAALRAAVFFCRVLQYFQCIRAQRCHWGISSQAAISSFSSTSSRRTWRSSCRRRLPAS